MTQPDPSFPSPQPPDPSAPMGMAPMPIAALPYAFAAPQIKRPGIVTSIGVISIVVACVSALASLASGCQAASLYFISVMSANMPAPPAANTSTANANATSYTMSVPAPAANALTPTQVNSAVQAVQWTAGATPTQAQLTALRAALANPSQQLVLPGNPASSPSSGVIDGMGNAYITFPGGGVASINPQGQTLPNAFANPLSMFNVNKVACGLTVLDALLSLGMAIFLFVSGILMLRSSPRSRRLHIVYAVLKIPLVLCGTAAVTWMYAEYYAAIVAAVPGSGTGGIMRGMAIGWGVGFAAAGLTYPISLLIALNTDRMRNYFVVAPLATRQ